MKEKANMLDTITLMLQKLQINMSHQSLSQYSSGQLSKLIKQSVHNTIEREWREKLVKKPGKLKSYCLFKTEYKLEPYLFLVPNKAHRNKLAQLRCSSHDLKIEKGRYKNIAPIDRICSLCEAQEIEDEQHFLCSCEFYKTERKEFLTKMFNINPNIRALQPHMLFLWLMTCEDKAVCTETAKFIYYSFKKRQGHQI